MFKSIILFSTLLCAFTSSLLFSICMDDDCCPSVECTIGWRRDNLDWKVKHMDSSYIPGKAKSHIRFDDINSYTLSAKAQWAGSAYYIRLSGEYGLSDKGRAKERFHIHSPYLYYPISVETNEHIKRRSEVYDFDAAVGYPLSFCCCRLNIIPLIGFSFHRQHLRVKDDNYFSCYSSCSSGSSSSSCGCCSNSSSSCSHHSSCSEFFDYHSSDSFFLDSSNPFRSSPSSNPFHSSSSDPIIASELGLGNPHRTQNYRFTWYGFYLGADIAYALDPCWTLFSEIEFHFLDRAHRKRKSWTGVDFVDEYHKEGWAYGYNAVVGMTYSFSTCWYSTIAVDFDWWKSDAKDDDLHWKKVGAKIGLGYMF